MNFDFEISTDDCISKENYFSHFILKQETWKFHENHVFQLLHETRKTFQVQSIELMYFSFNDFLDEFRVN